MLRRDKGVRCLLQCFDFPVHCHAEDRTAFGVHCLFDNFREAFRNLFACSQNVRSVHPGLRKNTVWPASFQALTSCGLQLIATSAVTMTRSSSLANAFIQTASSTLGRNSSRR